MVLASVSRWGRRLQELALAPGVPFVARLHILWMHVRRRLVKCSHDYALSVGPGRIFLDPCHDPDVATVNEIFILQQYAADYRHTIVVDLGAHKGCFTLYAALGQADWILSFEPEEQNFHALSRAAMSLKSGSTKCLTYREAVAGRDEELDFYVTGQSWSHSLFPRTDRGESRSVRVRTRTLDGVIAEAQRVGGSARRIIVKMDVEGAEWDILLSVSDEVLAEIAEMYIEMHPRPGHTLAGLVSRLAGAGLQSVPSTFDSILHVRRVPLASS
jgi:FkbM family methyltransferase